MNITNKIKLDELDLKVINELPLISEVLTSTINKLTSLFEPIISEINEICRQNTPSGWRVDKKKLENIIYPFTTYYGKDTISILENFFHIKNEITIFKESNNKRLNYFWIRFGLFYSEATEESTPELYFLITRSPNEKYEGILFPKDFYNGILSKVKGFQVEINHPDNGDEMEFISISDKVTTSEKLYEVYELFKTEVLIPYLSNVNQI